MKHFNVGIKAVIVRDDKVLLMKTNDDPPYWEMPGGRIDDDESIEQTLDRELHEELPNITSYKVHGILNAFRLQKDIKPALSLFLVFYKVTASFAGDKLKLSDEHSDYVWLTKTEALKKADVTSQAAIKKALV